MSPLILGAGPAGCTAAIKLAREGARPLLLDRSEDVGDLLCGGFLSWRTAAQLRATGCDPAAVGGWPVTRLRLFTGKHESSAPLPSTGYGLSRHALDSALRRAAIAAGAHIAFDYAKGVEPGLVHGRAKTWRGDAVFLASGKHDVRGLARPRTAADPALGLRLRIDRSAALARLVGDAIELHLFNGGYAGIVRQENGSVNICLAVRKSLLSDAGGSPAALLNRLASSHPAFARRMDHADGQVRYDSIASVPYGFIGRSTEPGLFRLGDQAAVIPSLAGEGMSIAVASGLAAAQAYLAGGAAAAPAYQKAFARRAKRPVRTAQAVWYLAEKGWGASVLTGLAGLAPSLTGLVMQMSRITQSNRVTHA